MDRDTLEAIFLAVLMQIDPEPADYFSEAHTRWQYKVRDLLREHGVRAGDDGTELTPLLQFYVWMTVQRKALSSQNGLDPDLEDFNNAS